MTEQAKVVSRRGGNATLPCTFQRDPSSAPNPKLRIKWTKLTSDYLKEIDVFVAMGYHKKSYGSFHGRVHLQDTSENDASLVITEITLEDYGKYKCEVIDGLDDGTGVVSLDLQGELVANIQQGENEHHSKLSETIQVFTHWRKVPVGCYNNCGKRLRRKLG